MPAFEEGRARALAKFKNGQALKLAEDTATKTLQSLKSGAFKDLQSASSSLGLGIKEVSDLKESKKEPSGIFTDKEVRANIFSISAPQVSSKVFKVADNFYLIQVNKVSKPIVAESKDKLLAFQRQESSRLGEILTTSILNSLKAKAEISFDDNLLAQDG